MKIEAHGDGIYGVTFTTRRMATTSPPPSSRSSRPALDEVLAKPDLTSVVLAGEGEHFCAGARGPARPHFGGGCAR